MKSIETKFVGATDTKPGRVRVNAWESGVRWFEYDSLIANLYQIFSHYKRPTIGRVPNSSGDYVSYNEIFESQESYFSHYIAAATYCDFHAWNYRELRGGSNSTGDGYNFVVIPY